MANMKKAAAKLLTGGAKPGLAQTTEEKIFCRKMARIEKIAKRMKWNRARPEEIEIFEKYKKDFGIKEVWFNNYTREWMIE